MQNLTFTPVSYSRISLNTIASIQVCGPTPAKSNRNNTVTVQDPTALFLRNDGKVTIQARDRHNTRTLSITGRVLILTAYNGECDFMHLC